MANLNEIIDIISRGADAFISVYYPCIDNNPETLPSLVESNAAIVYNGNPMVGGHAYAQLYASMPRTQHTVTGYNCHPITLLGDESGSGLVAPGVVLVTEGKVRIGSDNKRNLCGFTETLILKPQPDGKYMVSSTGYRIIFRTDNNLEP
ncbi:uncharacterized protein V1516DRAFT_644690 [Lipomyces oligophaga]|uniref:uncharacterized protein n=1 Tax=Lipomyces oligophaga TaxID=45792 RepID=UPI0034CD4034